MCHLCDTYRVFEDAKIILMPKEIYEKIIPINRKKFEKWLKKQRVKNESN